MALILDSPKTKGEVFNGATPKFTLVVLKIMIIKLMPIMSKPSLFSLSTDLLGLREREREGLAEASLFGY